MKKFIVALIALMFLLVVACGDSGTVQAEGAVKNTEDANFVRVDIDGRETVLCHEETGVCYLIVHNTYGVGLTVMLNPDGTPYVWEDNHE